MRTWLTVIAWLATASLPLTSPVFAQSELAALDRAKTAYLDAVAQERANLQAWRNANARLDEMLQRMADENGALSIELSFSSPIVLPPVVALNGIRVSMNASGRTPSALWRGVIASSAMTSGDDVLSVSLDPNEQPYSALDSDPGTIPWRLSPN
jgi:hypothetical protein